MATTSTNYTTRQAVRQDER